MKKSAQGKDVRKFKVGDRVVETVYDIKKSPEWENKNKYAVGTVCGFYTSSGEILVRFDDYTGYDFNDNPDDYHYLYENSLVLLEVYNSPLYKALKED